jgi:hypothetical protein
MPWKARITNDALMLYAKFDCNARRRGFESISGGVEQVEARLSSWEASLEPARTMLESARALLWRALH